MSAGKSLLARIIMSLAESVQTQIVTRANCVLNLLQEKNAQLHRFAVHTLNSA